METGALLHILWRRRILVVIGAVLAILVALEVGGKPGAGAARAKVDVLLDTHASQLVDARPARVASLSWRAHLLSQLLGTQSAQGQIAARAGISSDELAVIDSELAVPTIPASLPRVAAEAAADPPEPYVLTVESDAMAPLVSLRARGPDRDAAARLANAAVVTLETSCGPRRPRRRRHLRRRPGGFGDEPRSRWRRQADAGRCNRLGPVRDLVRGARAGAGDRGCAAPLRTGPGVRDPLSATQRTPTSRLSGRRRRRRPGVRTDC